MCCSNVRSEAVAVLSLLLQADKSSIQKLVLLHTDHCLHGHEQINTINTPRSQALQTIISSGKSSKTEIQEKLQRSVKDITKYTIDHVGRTGQQTF